MKVLLAPDVYVNASVAGGTAPQQVAQRVLQGKAKAPTTSWVLARVEGMLRAHGDFKAEAVPQQMETVRGLVEILDDPKQYDPADWETALIGAAQAAGVTRVITDHPDLVNKELQSVEFVSTETWLLEQSIPPPPPGQP